MFSIRSDGRLGAVNAQNPSVMSDEHVSPVESSAEDNREEPQSTSQNKIDAIYDLRAAVEQQVHAEHAAAEIGTPEARDVLLDATLNVEAKTQDAIEACHDCGRVHASDEAHERLARVGEMHDSNIIDVDFSRGQDSD